MSIRTSTWFRRTCRLILTVFVLESSYAFPPGMEFPWQVALRFGPSEALGQEMPEDITDQITCIGADPFVADNLKCTPEADTTDPYIIQKAAELRGATDQETAEKIFEFVRDDIAYEVYVGSLRGARGTLWSNAGNSVDQASLMIALLRVAGVGAEYATGTLNPLDSRELIESMFDPLSRALGCPSEDAAISDPPADPVLLSDVSNHTWVVLADFGPADPSFARASIGQEIGALDRRSYATDPESRHEVSFALEAEVAGTGLLHELTTSVVLAKSAAAPALYGRTAAIGNLVSRVDNAFFGVPTFTYSPYVDLNGVIFRGTDFSEIGIGAAQTFLTGLFLEIAIASPGGVVRSHRRDLVDRVGFSARQTGAVVELGGRGQFPAVSELDVVAVVVAPGTLALEHIRAAHDDHGRLRDDLAPLLPELQAIERGDAIAADPVEVLRRGRNLMRGVARRSAEGAVHAFIGSADISLGQLEAGYLTKAYYATPRVILGRVSSGGDEGDLAVRLDILENDVSAIPTTGQVTGVGFFLEIARGLIESGIEHEILNATPGLTPTSGVSVLRNLPPDNALEWLQPGDEDRLRGLDISDDAKARIRASLAEGNSVLTPGTMARVGGRETVAWFRVREADGHTISVSEDGGNQALLQYGALTGFANPVAQSAAMMSGFHLGFSAAIFQFVGGLLSPSGGQSFDQVVKDAKAAVFEAMIGRALKLGLGTVLSSLDAPALRTAAMCVIGAGVTGGQPDSKSILDCILGVVPFLFPSATVPFKGADRLLKAGSIGALAGMGIALGWIQVTFPVDPPVFPFLSGSPSTPRPPVSPSPGLGIAIAVEPDPLFTIAAVGTQFGGVFRAFVTNEGDETQEYRVTADLAQGALPVRVGAERITVAPGETGEVSICVGSADSIPDVGTIVDLYVSVAHVVDANVRAETQVAMSLPPAHGIGLRFSPNQLSLKPGEAATVDLQVSGRGNVAETVDFSVVAPPGVLVEGLPQRVSISEGAVEVLQLTIRAAPAGAEGVHLAWVSADLCGDNEPCEVLEPSVVTEALRVGVGSAATRGTDWARIDLERMGDLELATHFSLLTDALVLLEGNTAPASICHSARIHLANIVTLMNSDPELAAHTAPIVSLRDLAAACDVDGLFSALPSAFDTIEPIIAGRAKHRFSVAVSPRSIEHEPGEGDPTIDVRLQNLGTDTTTVDLALTSSIPADVGTSGLPASVTLAPGEVRDVAATVGMTNLGDANRVFPVTVTGTAQEAASQRHSATAHVAVRPALAKVISVTPSPNAIDSGETIMATADIMNSANAVRSLIARFDVPGTAIVPVDVALDLVPSLEPTAVPTTVIPTADLPDGLYDLRMSLFTSGGHPLGSSATAPFYVGQPVTARAYAAPSMVPPGDAVVKTNVEVSAGSPVGPVGDGGPQPSLNCFDQPTYPLGLWAGPTCSGCSDRQFFQTSISGAWSDGGNRAFSIPQQLRPGEDVVVTFTEGTSYREDVTFRVSADGCCMDAEFGGQPIHRCWERAPVAPLFATVEWHWAASAVVPESTHAMVTPIVASLTDDNGDGRIDDEDVPDVVFSTTASLDDHTCERPGELRAVSGDTGLEIFTVTDPAYAMYPCAAVAIGDIDDDSFPEIVGVRPGGLVILEHDGTLKGFSDPIATQPLGAPLIADLDRDGVPEIVYGGNVFESDGSLRFSRPDTGNDGFGSLSLAADLDLAGGLEVVVGFRAYQADGSTFYDVGAAQGYPAVGNFDNDPNPEVVVVSDGNVFLLEHNGTLKWGPVGLGGGRGGPPTVADFDGDGELEIGVAGDRWYTVLDADGAVRWQSAIRDFSSNLTGAAAFDFQSDGSAEVVYNDEHNLWILDGTTGAVLHRQVNPSCTGNEYPVIADVDADGAAEIIVSRNGICGISGSLGVFDSGLLVIGSANGSWAPTRGVWNQHAYSITNVNDNGSIPQFQKPNWLQPGLNNFRMSGPMPIDFPCAEGGGSGFAESIQASIRHEIRPDRYDADLGSISPLAEAASPSEISWSNSLACGESASFMVTGTALNMAPGEVREVSEGTEIIATIGARSCGISRSTSDSVSLGSWVPVVDPFQTPTLQHTGGSNCPFPSWDLLNGDTAATIACNGGPAVLLSDFDLANAGIDGTWRVNTTDDDDIFGIVFGYQDPQHFYLLQWAQNGLGLSLAVIDADSPLNVDDVSYTGGVSVAGDRARVLHYLDVPWADQTDYEWSLDFDGPCIGVSIRQGGVPVAEFSVTDDTYSTGKFGFWYHSQPLATYTSGAPRQLPGGVGGIERRLTLPPVTIVAKHIVGITPATETAAPGAVATYMVELSNPLPTDITYNLSEAGLNGFSEDLPASQFVGAGQTVNLTMNVAVPAQAENGASVFSVVAQAGGFTDSATAALVVDGEAPPVTGLERLAVAVELEPLTETLVKRDVSGNVVETNSTTRDTVGQGTDAMFRVKVTNLGEETDSYDLTHALPAGFLGRFQKTDGSVVTSVQRVLPGLGNFREVLLVLTGPDPSPAGTESFSVTAKSQTDADVDDTETASVNVSQHGVLVQVSPNAGVPGQAFDVTVANTGEVPDSFDLEIGGPAGNDATPRELEVGPLNPGEGQTISVAIGPLGFALPGGLNLVAKAKSQAEPRVLDTDVASIAIPTRRSVSAQCLPTPQEADGQGNATFLFIVDNLGNREEPYSARIISTGGGAVSAFLEGLEGIPANEVEIFRLPGLSTGAVPVLATLTGNETATIMLEVKTQEVTEVLTAMATCTLETGVNDPPVLVAPAPAPAPALSERAIALVLAILCWLGLRGIFRLRRREQQS